MCDHEWILGLAPLYECSVCGCMGTRNLKTGLMIEKGKKHKNAVRYPAGGVDLPGGSRWVGSRYRE